MLHQNHQQQQQQQHVVSLLRSLIVTIVWPGLGLLGESYVVFSLGTVPALLMSSTTTVTSTNILLTGIVLGMVTMGAAASIYGRRWGSIGTALWMWCGSMGIGWWGSTTTTSSSSSTALSCAVFLLGLGVGGEYPMAAASASERPVMTTTTAAMTTGVNDDPFSFTRGQHIQLVFSMQGMGILLNCAVLWVLLVVFHLDDATTDATSTIYERKVRWLWRILYGIGVVLLGTLCLTRVLHLQESTVWEQDRKQQKQSSSSSTSALQQAIMEDHDNNDDHEYEDEGDPCGTIQLCPTVSSLSSPSVVLKDVYLQQQRAVSSSSLSPSGRGRPDTAAAATKEEVTELYLEQRQSRPTTSATTLWFLAWELYGLRLVGVSLSWFLWDVAFYGNKLFQSVFLSALLLDSSSTTTLHRTHLAAAATVNAAVAACGYLTAAAVVDRVGRRTLQLVGFGVTGLLFVLVGVGLDVAWPRTVLLFLYLGTSFVGQVGPNATTFLVPAEVFPTAWRTTVHGIAAASGKLGALAASVVFTRITAAVVTENDDDASTTAGTSNSDLFLYSGYASLLGAVVTYWTIPEATPEARLLSELDRQWRQAVDHGRVYAVPTCLSVYERIVWERKQQARNGEYLTSDVHNAVYA